MVCVRCDFVRNNLDGPITQDKIYYCGIFQLYYGENMLHLTSALDQHA
jgi:hypothetical protein